MKICAERSRQSKTDFRFRLQKADKIIAVDRFADAGCNRSDAGFIRQFRYRFGQTENFVRFYRPGDMNVL